VTLQVGESWVFMLLSPPQDACYRVEFEGCARGVEDLGLVEDALGAAERTRKAYLAHEGARAPAVFDAATRLDKRLRDMYDFPFTNPGYQMHLESGPRTTDVLLRFHLHDRGGMWGLYAVISSPEKIEAARLREIVPALLASRDDKQQWVGAWIIQNSPGNAFIEEALRAITSDAPWVWKFLAHWKEDDALRARLEALLDLAAERRCTSIWPSLAKGNCFEEVVIDRAITRLADAREGGELEDALRTYLDAARVARGGSSEGLPTAEAYRAWFASHPGKKDR